MRKNHNRTSRLKPLLVGSALILSGCTITPEQAAVEETASQEQSDSALQTQESTNNVYVVDSADDIQIDNLPTTPAKNNATVKTSAPEEYIVQQGDTLWDISSKFLNQPWYWPEIWYLNPQVQNPHLIYPGDVINLFYVGGRPYLTVNGENRISGIERLSPVMRGEPIDATEKIIPIQVIEQFLTRPLIVDTKTLENSPHIVASRDNRIVYGSNDSVYLRDASDLSQDSLYNIYRPGATFEDPDTGEILGYEAIHVGDGKVTRDGEPATLYITEANREILRGDRILKVEQLEVDSDFRPRAPEADIQGKIIHLHNAITQSGTYQIVVANVGQDQGLEKGHVLAINKAGRSVTDVHADKGQTEIITLPNEHSADAIVYRVFDKVSYMFILDANRPVRMGDMAATPE